MDKKWNKQSLQRIFTAFAQKQLVIMMFNIARQVRGSLACWDYADRAKWVTWAPQLVDDLLYSDSIDDSNDDPDDDTDDDSGWNFKLIDIPGELWSEDLVRFSPKPSHE